MMILENESMNPESRVSSDPLTAILLMTDLMQDTINSQTYGSVTNLD